MKELHCSFHFDLYYLNHIKQYNVYMLVVKFDSLHPSKQFFSLICHDRSSWVEPVLS